jgi:hypothetical protein
MKKVKIRNNVWDTNGGGNPFVVFAAGELYEQNPQSNLQVTLGNAELVDVEDEKPAEPAAPAPAPAPAEAPAPAAEAAPAEAPAAEPAPATKAAKAKPAA